MPYSVKEQLLKSLFRDLKLYQRIKRNSLWMMKGYQIYFLSSSLFLSILRSHSTFIGSKHEIAKKMLDTRTGRSGPE